MTPTLGIYDRVPTLLFGVVVHRAFKEQVITVSLAVTILVVKIHDHSFPQLQPCFGNIAEGTYLL